MFGDGGTEKKTGSGAEGGRVEGVSDLNGQDYKGVYQRKYSN